MLALASPSGRRVLPVQGERDPTRRPRVRWPYKAHEISFETRLGELDLAMAAGSSEATKRGCRSNSRRNLPCKSGLLWGWTGPWCSEWPSSNAACARSASTTAHAAWSMQSAIAQQTRSAIFTRHLGLDLAAGKPISNIFASRLRNALVLAFTSETEEIFPLIQKAFLRDWQNPVGVELSDRQNLVYGRANHSPSGQEQFNENL